MKKCFREKCGKEFEPKKPKAKFCSDTCRVYHSREEKRKELKKALPPQTVKERNEPQQLKTKEIKTEQSSPKTESFMEKRLRMKLGL